MNMIETTTGNMYLADGRKIVIPADLLEQCPNQTVDNVTAWAGRNGLIGTEEEVWCLH